MTDMDALDRLIATEVVRASAPPRFVDDAAIYRASTATSSPTRRFRSMFGAMKFVAAAGVVALFGGLLAISQPFDRGGHAPGAASDSESSQGTSVGPPGYTRCGREDQLAIDLEPGVLYGLGLGVMGFSVPTSGWTLYPSNDGWTIEKGPCVRISMGWDVPSNTVTFGRPPDGLMALPPCGIERGDPFAPEIRDIGAGHDWRQQRADIAAAVAAIPGVDVIEGPSHFDLPNGFGEVAATYVAVAVPDCKSSPLWYDWDTGSEIRPRGPRDWIGVWIVDYQGHALIADTRIWIESDASSPDMDDEIKAIVASVQPLGG